MIHTNCPEWMVMFLRIIVEPWNKREDNFKSHRGYFNFAFIIMFITIYYIIINLLY